MLNAVMFNFEKLDVWQKAIDFADLVYNHTRDFPADERFGLTNQMRRAAVSISSNIAEGTSRMSQTDFARFTEIAYRLGFRGCLAVLHRPTARVPNRRTVSCAILSGRGNRSDAERTAKIVDLRVTAMRASVDLSTLTSQL